jgi:DNA (cytosine-5)-methyltransferase 1
VCSGIEAASVAWHPLGWEAAWFSEIEPFPSAVLKHHYPDVSNLGDMTTLPERILFGEVEAPDLFCGGTPCQAFSVAGLRKSLDDARGNLSLTFCEIANAIDSVRYARREPAAIIFWENVPGVLNTKDNAFGCFLAELAGEDQPLKPPGERWTDAGCVFGPTRAVAWRVLDAQYFGLAQRRKRVFVVASARNGFDPAAVLFELKGVRRDTAPSREAGEAIAQCLTTGVEKRYDAETETLPVINTIDASYGNKWGSNQWVDQGHAIVQPVTYDFFNITAPVNRQNRTPGDPCHTLARSNAEHAVLASHPTQDPIMSENVCHAIGANANATAAVAFTTEQTPKFSEERALTLTKQSPTGGGQVQSVMQAMQVRRLTPVECERLQGFPDNYTAIPWRKKPAAECPDGPRYKALGNSWAVPVVRWIGKRIDLYVKTLKEGE